MTDGRAEYERGVKLFNARDYEGAVKLWSKLKARRLKFPNLDLYLAVATREADLLCRFVESCTADLDRIFKDIGSDLDERRLDLEMARAREYISAGEYSEALDCFTTLIDRGIKSFTVFLGAARTCLAMGLLQQALSFARDAGSLDPGDSRAYAVLGGILLELDRGREAERAFRKAIELDEANASAWFGLGSHYFETKRYDLAESFLRRVLLLRPGWISASSLLDEVGRQVEQTDELIRKHLRVLEQHPEYADQHHKLGICYTYQGRYKLAIKCFDNALAVNPGLLKSLVQKAHVLSALESFEQACSTYRKACEQSGDYDPSIYREGLELEKAKNFQEAADRYADALCIQPDYASRHFETASKFLEVGLLEQAERECRRGLAVAPDYPDGHVILGNTALASGDTEEAASCFRRALSINPCYLDAAENLAKLLKAAGDSAGLLRLKQAWSEQCGESPSRLSEYFEEVG